MTTYPSDDAYDINVCPACGSGRVLRWRWPTWADDLGRVYQRMHCRDCGSRWTAVYQLRGLDNLDDNRPEEV